jgi:ribosome-associated protein
MAEPESRGLFVRPGVVVPESELEVQPLRAGGPGGQNVNKVSSGIQLRFDVARSGAFDAGQRERVLDRLASRLTKAGELVLRAVEHRDQARNLAAARERLARMLAEALHVAPPRRATRPTRGSQRRRLDQKRRNSERKSARRSGSGESD